MVACDVDVMQPRGTPAVIVAWQQACVRSVACMHLLSAPELTLALAQSLPKPPPLPPNPQVHRGGGVHTQDG
jgi:hypothetical protein